MTGIVGLMRVKNEARWISRSIASIAPLCDHILVLDDNSTDATASLARQFGNTHVLESPFAGLDEARDKNYLVNAARALEPDWCIMLDGDEVLEASGPAKVLAAITSGAAPAYWLHIVFLWDRDNQIRVDGVYRAMTRPSIFAMRETNGVFKETRSRGSNFHCGSVPTDLRGRSHPSGATVAHLGYMDRVDRLRKFAWYNDIDPHNAIEDEYRHMVIGDIESLPPGARTKHAGPLELLPWGGVPSN